MEPQYKEHVRKPNCFIPNHFENMEHNLLFLKQTFQLKWGGLLRTECSPYYYKLQVFWM